MVTLFVSHIRPKFDFCSTLWNVGYVGDMKKLESIQRRWTKEIGGLANLAYEDRLKRLKLFSVCGRLLRADLIKVFKIFHSGVDLGLRSMFEMQSHESTRGHRFKLSVPRCRGELRRRFFSVRVVTTWNSLPPHVVEAESVDSFKRKLERHMPEAFYQVRA